MRFDQTLQPAYGQGQPQQQGLNPGDQHPFAVDQWGLIGPPPGPGPEYANNFLPPLFANPFTYGIGNAMNQANWASQATPQASGFQQALYSPGMTPMEQAYLGSTAMLGARQLADTSNRIEGMFENSASHGSLAPALFEATNQYNQQLNQMAGQMGTQRQQIAAQAMPFTFGFPIQAYQAGQGMSEGLYSLGQNAMFGDFQFPLAMLGSNPVVAPTNVVTQTGGKS